MIVRRIAIASILAAGALAIAGCGMMNKAQGVMTVPLSGQNEVPPNAQRRLGHRQGRARRQRHQVEHHVLGHDRPDHRRPLPRPGPARRERRRRRAVRRPARQPDHRLGDADAGAGRPGQARPLVHQPAHRRQPGRRAARPGQVDIGGLRPLTPSGAQRTIALALAEAPPVKPTAAPSLSSSSRRRSTRRCTLPVVVIGKASMNSISFGYS